MGECGGLSHRCGHRQERAGEDKAAGHRHRLKEAAEGLLPVKRKGTEGIPKGLASAPEEVSPGLNTRARENERWDGIYGTT